MKTDMVWIWSGWGARGCWQRKVVEFYLCRATKHRVLRDAQWGVVTHRAPRRRGEANRALAVAAEHLLQLSVIHVPAQAADVQLDGVDRTLGRSTAPPPEPAATTPTTVPTTTATVPAAIAAPTVSTAAAPVAAAAAVAAAVTTVAAAARGQKVTASSLRGTMAPAGMLERGPEGSNTSFGLSFLASRWSAADAR